MVREKIAKYLKEKGIKQDYVAKQAGLSSNAFSALVNGKRNLDVEEYIKICTALEVSCDFFMPNEDCTKLCSRHSPGTA